MSHYNVCCAHGANNTLNIIAVLIRHYSPPIYGPNGLRVLSMDSNLVTILTSTSSRLVDGNDLQHLSVCDPAFHTGCGCVNIIPHHNKLDKVFPYLSYVARHLLL